MLPGSLRCPVGVSLQVACSKQLRIHSAGQPASYTDVIKAPDALICASVSTLHAAATHAHMLHQSHMLPWLSLLLFVPFLLQESLSLSHATSIVLSQLYQARLSALAAASGMAPAALPYSAGSVDELADGYDSSSGIEH
jgi:hypothetical protein